MLSQRHQPFKAETPLHLTEFHGFICSRDTVLMVNKSTIHLQQRGSHHPHTHTVRACVCVVCVSFNIPYVPPAMIKLSFNFAVLFPFFWLSLFSIRRNSKVTRKTIPKKPQRERERVIQHSSSTRWTVFQLIFFSCFFSFFCRVFRPLRNTSWILSLILYRD